MASVSDYTLADPQTATCPFGYYRAMREQSPVHRDPKLGMFIVSRYEDIMTALRAPHVFSSALGFAAQSAQDYTPEIDAYMAREGFGPIPMVLTSDPPAHTRIRTLVDKAFTAQRVAAMERYIVDLANQFIDRFIDAGKAEIVQDLAIPLPIYVIADQLGVDRSRIEDFKRWSNASVEPLGRLLTKERAFWCAQQMVELQHFLKARIDERRAQPRDDMISDLVHANTDNPADAPLDLGELFSVIRGLLVAGNETTTTAIGNGVLLLATHPEVVDGIRASSEPDSALHRLTEEILRLEAPVPGLPRVTLEDTELGGTRIPKGSHVYLAFASANRDDRKFENAEAFDPTRRNAVQHLSFGSGIHRCIGATLARMEIKCAMREVIRRLGDVRLAVPEERLEYAPSMVTRSLLSLPITFTKRA
ncbi:MAG TPA: cytochrome P450 [Nevskiaceae bacterium]|nr:cytochrome P450 [Nevskiaceae bacterium]